MFKNTKKSNSFLAIYIACIMLVSVFLPAVSASNAAASSAQGFSKGLSYESVVPLKRVTMVNFDKDGILDDYAYLAAVPTAVFNSGGKLFSNPLLFYQDAYPVKDDKERSLNARQGLDYFMEDWMTYSNNQLDKITLINLPQSKLNTSWKANNYTSIQGDDPYDIANKIALSDWSYSDNAVVAVIENQYSNPNIVTHGSVSGSISAYTVNHQTFNVKEPAIGTGGTYKYFDIIDKNYKYVVTKLSWSGTNDYDLQLYDTQLGMVDNEANGYTEQISEGMAEVAGSYIHNYGKWGVSVTAVPTKSIDSTDNTNDGKLITALKNLARTLKNTGKVDVSLYPGTMINIPQSPFGCRDVDFTLKWNSPNVHLGFTLLDPAGTEICSSLSREEITSGKVSTTGNGETTMHVDRLGECRPGDNYSICVFSLDSIPSDMDFTLQYTWHQNFSKIEGECFASATNGAVLASNLNAPLLYVSSSSISDETKDVLYKLGVNNIYLVNIGNHLSSDVKNKLGDIASVTEYNDDGGSLYTAINEKTGNNKTSKVSVFTTIDPWTYWYVAEDTPAGEYPGAMFVGPAAFIAAQHGCPVLIVDLYPQLSQATVYPTDFWVKTVATRDEPTAGSMLMSGKEVYSFLEKYGLGKLEPGKAAQQDQEILITVADQYDIGSPWDRMFTGAALNGRFTFSPVDTAYWISRDVFYPAMIFVNPATQGQTTLINGSSSKSKLIGGRLRDPIGSTLVITKKSEDEKFTYPILETYNTYAYKVNEKGSKNWGFYYTTADGIIPYVTPSPDPIDDGVTDKAGAYYPDIDDSSVVPFYATRAGYDNVYSTNFNEVVKDLNRGVILWQQECHGSQGNGGTIAMWDSNNPYIHEENPWRAYEPIMLYPGHIRDFVHWVIYDLNGYKSTLLTKVLIKFHLFPEIGSTENPDVASANVQRVLPNKILQKLHIPFNLWAAHGIVVYRDRLLHPLKALKEGLHIVNFYNGDDQVTISPISGRFTLLGKNGIDFDNALGNLHSCGLNTVSCLPAYTYLHLTWLRHGMSYQIIDPWTTSDWSSVWIQMMIKRFAMGDTVGKAYELGMRACAPEPIVGQSWWDTLENVELFGDPNLRAFVPGTDYSSNNYWEQKDTLSLSYGADVTLDGHMPFGVTSYPHEKTPNSSLQQYIWIILVVAIIVILVIAAFAMKRRKK